MEIELIKTLIKNKRQNAYGALAFGLESALYSKVKEWSGKGSIPSATYSDSSQDTILQMAKILRSKGYDVFVPSPAEYITITIREND